MKKYFPVIAVLILALSCGDNAPTSSAEPVNYENFGTLEMRASKKYAHVVAEIETFLKEIAACPIDPNSGEGWCEFVKVGFIPRAANPKSQGQRILVLDRGMSLPAYTRYKSRVLDFLSSDEAGIYKPSSKEIEIPRGELYILSHILGEKYPDTPAIALNSIVRLQRERPIFRAPAYGPGHGDRVFGTLADLNPEAEFVVANRGVLPSEKLLKSKNETEFFATLSAYLDNTVSSLIATIQKYEINFVNMSFGDTVDTLERQFAGLDPAIASGDFYKRVLRLIKERYYDRLFSLNDVIFVQAATWSNRVPDEGDEEFLPDCTSYKNRIRAGSIERKVTDVPYEGARRADLLVEEKAQKCIDLFFNSGVIINADLEPELGDYPYLSTFDGLGLSYPNDDFSSSWAAPFILSFLNFKKQEALALGHEFSISGFQNTQLIMEPVKYKQFEIFRIGRM